MPFEVQGVTVLGVEEKILYLLYYSRIRRKKEEATTTTI